MRMRTRSSRVVDAPHHIVSLFPCLACTTIRSDPSCIILLLLVCLSSLHQLCILYYHGLGSGRCDPMDVAALP